MIDKTLADRVIDNLNEADAAMTVLVRTFPKNPVIKLMAGLVTATACIDGPPPPGLWDRLAKDPDSTIDMLAQSLMGMAISSTHLSMKEG